MYSHSQRVPMQYFAWWALLGSPGCQLEYVTWNKIRRRQYTVIPLTPLLLTGIHAILLVMGIVRAPGARHLKQGKRASIRRHSTDIPSLASLHAMFLVVYIIRGTWVPVGVSYLKQDKRRQYTVIPPVPNSSRISMQYSAWWALLASPGCQPE